jgi:hypothetical protein
VGASKGVSTKGLERQKITKALAKKEGRLPAKIWKPDRIKANQAGNDPLGFESVVTSLTQWLNAISAED